MSKKDKRKPKQDENMSWKEKLEKDAKEKLGLEIETSQTDSVERAAGVLEMNHTDDIPDPARAPYNFVPLNGEVVEAEETPGQGNCTFDKYHEGRHTGYIELTIETKTPLYIRDTLTKQEMEEKERVEKDGKKKYINPDFFSPADKVRIPGSSLRGMIRTMVEMVSFGKFGFFDDKMLYFRGLADRSGIRKEYQNRMSSYDKNCKESIYKMSAGALIKRGFKYFILPSPGFLQIYKGAAREKVKVIGKEYSEFKYYKLDEGFLIISGNMQNKKRDWIIKYPGDSEKEIQIPDEDVENYKNDNNRHSGVPNLIELANKERIPCFYVRWTDARGNDRISFGHTGMFRLAYTQTIGEHIPPELKDESRIDIAEAIFGNEKTFTGRVFFEDAFLSTLTGDDFEGEKIPKTLLGPKPTTFQHYLVQTPENLNNHPKNLAHYNSSTAIRGYKLYWHKTSNWGKDDQNDFNPKIDTKIDTKIKPIKSGKIFTGIIRFENLSDVELGALLFALVLPDGCCHKLGMGKPLGLGSVKITPKLFLSKRKDRYENLFAEWETPIQESTSANENITHFKDKFKDYILKKIGETKTDLWKVERMKELKRMLVFNVGSAPNNRPSDDKIQYMKIKNERNKNEFRDRKVLPKPTKVR